MVDADGDAEPGWGGVALTPGSCNTITQSFYQTFKRKENLSEKKYAMWISN